MRKATCYRKLSIALESEVVILFFIEKKKKKKKKTCLSFEFLFHEYHARCSADFRVCPLVEIFLIKSRSVDRDNLA